MIRKISVKCTESWVKSGVITEDDKEAYQYGMELLLSTLLNFALMVVVSICVIKKPIAIVPYSIVYVPLRMLTGGYHADSHWQCVLYTQGTFAGFVLLVWHITEKLPEIALAGLIISSFIIWYLAPIEAKNKPLSERERERGKRYSRVLELVIVVVLLGMMFSSRAQNQFLIGGIAANISVSVSLLIGKYGGKKKKQTISCQ